MTICFRVVSYVRQRDRRQKELHATFMCLRSG